MNTNKLISLVIVSLMAMTAFGLFYDNTILVILGHIFTLPMVGVWYGVKRKWNITPIDKLMYIAYFVGSFSDSFILIGGQWGEILQILMTIVMHTLLIIIFRKEGTRIYSDKSKDLPKIFIPITIIFVFFGAVMMHILPDIIYFIAMFYAIQLMILISHGLFRQIKNKSYIWVAIGISLILVKDVLYCYNFFIYKNSILPLYIIQYSLSTIVYFMIAVGVALGQQNNSTENKETIWQYIKNHIKLFLHTHHLTHFYKNLPNSLPTFLYKKQVS